MAPHDSERSRPRDGTACSRRGHPESWGYRAYSFSISAQLGRGQHSGQMFDGPEDLFGALIVRYQGLDARAPRTCQSELGSHEEEAGKWVKIFVMREDTNDGEIVLKTKATQGGNLMISEIGFVEE